MEKSVIVFAPHDGQTVVDEYLIGEDNCVSIVPQGASVTIYFRDPKVVDSKKLNERPYKMYTGFPYMVKESTI